MQNQKAPHWLSDTTVKLEEKTAEGNPKTVQWKQVLQAITQLKTRPKL